jgi:hypothetical protein
MSAGLVALADRIELWPIDRLRPYERNPRTHSEAQVDQIAGSMVEFGWTNPILIDENVGILAGHGRLLAARKLGLAEVPVIRFEHLSEAQKRAYILADNQLALQAGWDDALLAEELAWLRGERFDLDLIGFDATELERLLAIADGETASDEAEDEVPDPPEDPVSKPGDLWVLGNHRLLCGDATVLADVERVLDGRRSHPVPFIRHHAEPASPGQWRRHRHHHNVRGDRERYHLVDGRRDMATGAPRAVRGRLLARLQYGGGDRQQRLARHLPVGLGLLDVAGLQRRHRADRVLRLLLDVCHGAALARRSVRLPAPMERAAGAHRECATGHAPLDRDRRGHLPDGVASCRGSAGMTDWIRTTQGAAAIVAAIFATVVA